MQDYKAAFNDLAASIGGGGQTLAASLGADVRTVLTPSSGIVDKLSAYGTKAQAATNSLPWLKTISNNSPVSQVAPPIEGAAVPLGGMVAVAAVIVAFIFLRGR